MLPACLLGAGVLFWGWQTGNLAVAAALALALESPRMTRYRLALTEADYRRIADFSSALFALCAVLLVANRGAPRGVLSTLQWLPLMLAPVVLAQRFGTAGTIRLSALFHYMRRRKRRDPAMEDPAVDLGGPYLALLVIAAGAANVRGVGYFAGAFVLASWALLALRPRGAPLALVAAFLAIGAAGGYYGHTGLHAAQGWIEAWVDERFLQVHSDAERTRTAMGSIGRLKQRDAILLRLYAADEQAPRLRLLHSASFNDYRNGAWVARAAAAPEPPSSPPKATAAIALRTQPGRNLLPLPPGTLEVVGLGSLGAQRTGLGAVAIESGGGWLRYEAAYGDADPAYGMPGQADLAIPSAERAVLERLAAELRLRSVAPAAAMSAIEAHLGGFSYSLWRERAPREGTTALGEFLLNSRSGHCEYFASAATLLLRAAGIPARYATGFAAFERSALEGGIVVRARHAHAWTRAWVDGRWVDFDPTPPSWPAAEAGLAPAWEGLADLARWALFRWSTRTEEEAPAWAWALVGALVALLAWRLARLRGTRRAAPALAAFRAYPGADSEFGEVVAALGRRYRPRAADEPLSHWLPQAARHAAVPASEASALLALHHRYRFDPRGLRPEERAALRERSVALARALL